MATFRFHIPVHVEEVGEKPLNKEFLTSPATDSITIEIIAKDYINAKQALSIAFQSMADEDWRLSYGPKGK